MAFKVKLIFIKKKSLIKTLCFIRTSLYELDINIYTVGLFLYLSETLCSSAKA